MRKKIKLLGCAVSVSKNPRASYSLRSHCRDYKPKNTNWIVGRKREGSFDE